MTFGFITAERAIKAPAVQAPCRVPASRSAGCAAFSGSARAASSPRNTDRPVAAISRTWSRVGLDQIGSAECRSCVFLRAVFAILASLRPHCTQLLVFACNFRGPRFAPVALHSIACFCVQFSRSSLRSGRIALYVPHIRPAFALSNGTCGGPRMNRDLFDKGPEIGRHRTARVMRQNQPITRPGRFRRPGGGMGFPLSIHSFFPGVMKPRAWPQPWAQSRAPAPGGPEQRSVRARTSVGHPAASPRPSSRDPIPAARLAVALLRWARSR